jgi:hypothetical protein
MTCATAARWACILAGFSAFYCRRFVGKRTVSNVQQAKNSSSNFIFLFSLRLSAVRALL